MTEAKWQPEFGSIFRFKGPLGVRISRLIWFTGLKTLVVCRKIDFTLQTQELYNIFSKKAATHTKNRPVTAPQMLYWVVEVFLGQKVHIPCHISSLPFMFHQRRHPQTLPKSDCWNSRLLGVPPRLPQYSEEGRGQVEGCCRSRPFGQDNR